MNAQAQGVSATRRKKSTKPRAALALSETTADAPSARTDAAHAVDLQMQVAEAAYYLAERRRFEPGYELQDWLSAEAQVTGRD